MEFEQRYELLWVLKPILNCTICQGAIYAEEVELILDGSEPLVYDWTLGCCEQCGQWYGLIADLLGALMEIEAFPDDVDGFLLDGEPARAGIWADLPVGAIPWEDFREHAIQFGAPSTEPPPTPDEIRALPLLSESWELGVQVGPWFLDEDGTNTPSYVALVLDPAAGIRHHDVKGVVPHDAPELARVILEAAARPHVGKQGRPLELHLADADLADALSRELADAEITVRAAPTPLADEVIFEMTHTMTGVTEDPFFTAYDEAAMRAFFRAAKTFFRTRPWERIADNKYVAFRLGDAPWGYLSIIGQMGEEFGMSIFEDWLQLCALIHNQPTPWDYMMGVGEEKALEAAGAMEGLTLEPLQSLHPEDAEYVRQLGLKATRKGLYPNVRRFTIDGLELPQLSLPDYQALMEALADTISKRRAQKISSIKQTVDVGGLPVTLRYPARGDEAFEDAAPGGFRLVVRGLDKDSRGRSRATRVEIDAPGTARVDEVVRALRREDEYFWVTAITTEEYAVWTDGRQPRSAPCPRVAQLAGLPDLALEAFEDVYPMQVMPRMGAVISEILVKYVGV